MKKSTNVKNENEDDDDDSDFEDPDLIEIPGGGKSLQTLKGSQNWKLATVDEFSTFSSKNNHSIHSCFLGGGDDKKLKKEDDLQIINEIPGKSLGMGNRPMHSASTASSLSGLFPQGNLFNSPSLLAAQDPFFALNSALQGAGGSSTNTMDLLQKCKFFSSFSIALIMNDFTREERKMSAARIQSLNLYSFFF